MDRYIDYKSARAHVTCSAWNKINLGTGKERETTMANRARNYYHKSWRKLGACVYTLHHLCSISPHPPPCSCLVYMLLRGNSLNIQQFQLWEVMQINSLIACFLLHHCCSSPKWNTKLAISQYIVYATN